MTNTLHRYGNEESFYDDYVIFAIANKGGNDANALPKLRRFLEIALEYKPVNLGDSAHGGALRPCRSMTPTSHWKRDMTPDFRTVVEGLDAPSTCAAVFDNIEAAKQFVERIKQEDLGLSINISTSIINAEECCDHACINRHSVGYSLGFEGSTDNLPSSNVLMLSTMCGHGMVSHTLARKMMDWVKEGRRTPDEAVTYMARFCSCGVFNPSRARRVLEECLAQTST